MRTNLNNGEALLGLAMIAVGLGLLAASFTIEVLSAGIAPRVFPMTASALIVLLGALQAQSALQSGEDGTTLRELPHLLALLLLSVGYVWSITYFGYLISTAIAAPIALWLFGVRSKLGLALSVILCPALYHLVFFIGLDVFPPYGEWFDLLDVIEGY